MRLRSSASATRRRLVRSLVCGVTALCLHAGLARGAEVDPVDALIQKGSEARSQGHDEDALKLFEQADAIRRSPTTRAQIALAEQALGLWVKAEAHLLEALSQPNDPWVQKHKPALEGALATIQQHVGTLELRGLAPNVTVAIVIDGAPISKAPSTSGFRVESGKRQLEVRARGYHPLTRTVWIPEGGVARETLTLVPDTGRRTDDPGSNGPDTSIHVSSTRRTLGWVSVAVGGAAAVFGGVSLGLRQGAVDSYNSPECPGLGPTVVQSAACQSHIDAEGTWKTVALSSFIGAGVLVLTGVVLVATAPSPASPRAAAASSFVHCGAGFLCPVRF